MSGHLERRRFLQLLGGAGAAAAALPLGQLGARSHGAVPHAQEGAGTWPSVPPTPFQPDPSLPDPEFFAALRGEFLFPREIAYCNTGTLGACPREVLETLTHRLQTLEEELPDWPYLEPNGEPLTGYQPLEPHRSLAGRILNAPAQEIAITQNATMGCSFLANGIELEPGDEVLSTDQEHSGGIGGWRLRAARHGVVLRELHLDGAVADGPEGVVRLFADAITPRTKVLAFSHITSAYGIVLPAKELCDLARSRGIVSVVDGAQSAGQIEVDVKVMGCDAYVTSPHKWLLAPKGTGILYIRDEAQPLFWNTLASGRIDRDVPGAFRFMQHGTGSPAIMHGLSAAIAFMERAGIERIARWDRMLTDRLREGLESIPGVIFFSPRDPSFAAGITTFGVEGVDGRELQEALWASGIRVRAQSGERVRLSAHLYVSPEDIDRALEVTAALA